MATDDMRPPYDDLAAVIREIAASDAIIFEEAQYDSGDDFCACRYCGVHQFGGRKVPHAADCLYMRAQALAARLPPDGTQLP